MAKKTLAGKEIEFQKVAQEKEYQSGQIGEQLQQFQVFEIVFTVIICNGAK